ncbi:hypothetical protein HZC21_01135 [Candidatus Peregrinibacteria bacterium]|nr:hypothetical protein [Candidatus Peregrinibacteria bacterium]
MKKIAMLIALITLLSGCEVLDNLRASILQKGGETIDAAVKKVKEVKDQVKKTKESVEKKVEDVQNAVKEVKEATDQVQEALDAVKKVTGGEDKNGTTTK